MDAINLKAEVNELIDIVDTMKKSLQNDIH